MQISCKLLVAEESSEMQFKAIAVFVLVLVFLSHERVRGRVLQSKTELNRIVDHNGLSPLSTITAEFTENHVRSKRDEKSCVFGFCFPPVNSWPFYITEGIRSLFTVNTQASK